MNHCVASTPLSQMFLFKADILTYCDFVCKFINGVRVVDGSAFVVGEQYEELRFNPLLCGVPEF